LRGLVAQEPELVEARRALRAALREQKQKQEPTSAPQGGYPELEATFQAARTRPADADPQATLDGRAPTELAPTVIASSAAAPAKAPSSAPQSEPAPARGWAWAVGAFVVVAALASAALWRAAPSPVAPAASASPPPAVSEAGVAAPVAAVTKPGAAAAAVRPVHTLRVRSQPEGATVALDGGAAQGVTPIELTFDAGSEHRVTLSLEGYVAQEIRTKPGQAPATLDVTLEKVVPPGGVALASAYALDVVWRGRTLAQGETSPRVQLASGRQVLTLLAPSVFLKTEVTVDVPPGGEVQLQAPALGKLNVRATPDNCEVFVGETFVDYPPILDKPVAAGRYELSFKWPDGARSQQTVEVKAGAPAFVIGKKP
jgi:hypothetical protein